jgi:hypothetical protein
VSTMKYCGDVHVVIGDFGLGTELALRCEDGDIGCESLENVGGIMKEDVIE